MRPIVIDTNVVIALSDDADDHAHTVRSWLRTVAGDGVWLPAPCLVELMSRLPDVEQASAEGRSLMSRFRILPLDAPGAFEAGRLASQAGGLSALVEVVIEELGVKRTKAKQIVRTDIMILACAIARNGKLFTTDQALIKLGARCGVAERVTEIPRIPEQVALPLGRIP